MVQYEPEQCLPRQRMDAVGEHLLVSIMMMIIMMMLMIIMMMLMMIIIMVLVMMMIIMIIMKIIKPIVVARYCSLNMIMKRYINII